MTKDDGYTGGGEAEFLAVNDWMLKRVSTSDETFVV
jgi:hypothetical protein